jgi:threonine dehydratase
MVRRLALEDKMVVEGSGALAVAAAQEIPRAERGVSVWLVTGGSIDRDKLVSIL